MSERLGSLAESAITFCRAGESVCAESCGANPHVISRVLVKRIEDIRMDDSFVLDWLRELRSHIGHICRRIDEQRQAFLGAVPIFERLACLEGFQLAIPELA